MSTDGKEALCVVGGFAAFILAIILIGATNANMSRQASIECVRANGIWSTQVDRCERPAMGGANDPR